MDMGRDELVGASMGSNGSMVCHACFVFLDMHVDVKLSSTDPCCDCIVGSNVVGVRFVGQGPDQDGMGRMMVHHHEVLVATPSSDGESSHVIHE